MLSDGDHLIDLGTRVLLMQNFDGYRRLKMNPEGRALSLDHALFWQARNSKLPV